MSNFSNRLLAWYGRHGRYDLPWQQQPTSYCVWISEIMLQQTQVSTVIPYFQRFMQRFPDITTLAMASQDEVLHYWSGLGYYARARNLHKAAQIIVNEFHGVFPKTLEGVMALPGIGRSTAGAILSLACGQRHPILDGNVKRVLTRHEGIEGWPGDNKVADRLWQRAETLTPKTRVAEYTQAIMDLGATLCSRSRPDCDACPVALDCYAREHGLQQTLPTARKKAALPVRKTIFTIIEDDNGAVLLQRRPPVGIWGGLWGFPECPTDEKIGNWVRNRFGQAVSRLEEGEPLRHTFSHFHLDIRPVRIQLEPGALELRDEGDICWYHPDGARELGLAAPVLKLLQTLKS